MTDFWHIQEQTKYFPNRWWFTECAPSPFHNFFGINENVKPQSSLQNVMNKKGTTKNSFSSPSKDADNFPILLDINKPMLQKHSAHSSECFSTFIVV